MRRFSTLLLYVAIAFLLLRQLPWCYNFFVVKPEKIPFILHSFVIGDFALMRQEEGKGTARHDAAENTYSEAVLNSILPMFYFRQLMSGERSPDTINRIAITPKTAQMENFSFRSVPTDINAPSIDLYPLLKSMSGRVNPKMPDNVFRITSQGIEFTDMAPNSVNTEKSLLFTEAMTKKNFCFPAIKIVGNPTVKKEHDKGYLLLDVGRRLFHLKQVKGCPYVRAITLPEGSTLEYFYLAKFRDKKTFAFLTNINNALYVLKSRTYDVVKTGVPAFNLETDALTIIGSMSDWTVRVTSPSSDNYYVLNADDYSLIKKLENSSNTHYMPGISLTPYTDRHVMLRFEQ